jgi:hypothetical protein
VLAVRGGEMVDSIFGKESRAENVAGESMRRCIDATVKGITNELKVNGIGASNEQA